MTDWLTMIPQAGEEIAGYIDVVRAMMGASQAASKYFGPSLTDNVRKVFGRAGQMRAQVSKERHSEPSPSIVIPLVDAAMKESRPVLQEKWAAMLANAMLDDGRRVRRDFIETLNGFEPVDVLVLDIVRRTPLGGSPDVKNSPVARFQQQERAMLGISEDDWQVSSQMLRRVGVFWDNPQGGQNLLLPFGRLLLAACVVE